MKHHDLNLLVVLHALLESASVSEAARRLSTSQPSVSRMLTRLREDLGDQLLVKSSNTMVRTSRAEQLRPIVNEIMQLLRNVYQPADAYRIDAEVRTCLIGANDSLQSLFAAPLITSIRQLAPKALIRFKPVPYPNPMRLLMEGEIDLLVAMSNLDDHGFRSEILFESSFSCLCSTKNSNVGRVARMQELARMPYLDISHMGVISALTADIFESAGVQRKTVAAMSSFLAAPELIAISDMVSLIPSYLAPTLAHHDGVRVVPLDVDAATHSIRMVWHNSKHEDPFLVRVRELLRELARPAAAAKSALAAGPSSAGAIP